MKWLIALTVFPGLILGSSGYAPITSVVRQAKVEMFLQPTPTKN